MSAVLQRSVRRSRYQLGSSQERQSRFAAGLVAAIVSTALVGGLVYPARVMRVFAKSKTDIAALTAKKYAEEAYPEYAALHPDRQCPHALLELNVWMNNEDTLDPWGSPMVMHCGDTRSARRPRSDEPALGIVIQSAGEDRAFDTADDLWSDR